ncbi:MAG: GtrA family protein [Proteobacteria bacterium]|nr:GtrA family protein [Pseudomonadota bacterium]
MSSEAGMVEGGVLPWRSLRAAMALPARFIGVGAINTAVGLSLIQLGLWLGLGDYPANAFGYAGGFGCSYLLHRRVTFRADNGDHGRQLPRFAAAAALAYALNLLVVAGGQRLGLGGTIVPHIAATGVYAVAFYWLSRRFVFPDTGNEGADQDWPAQVEAAVQSRWLAAVLVFAAMLPMAFVATPPLVDAAGHMGRWIVQVDGGASPILRQWYDFKWGLLGNLGCDLLAQALIPVIGPEAALRAIVAMILGVQVLGVLALSRAVHGRIAPTAFFALPFVFGYPFQYGFLNFLLGEGFALLALALWIVMGRNGQARLRPWVFAVIGFGLWLAHTLALALFLIGAFCASVARATEGERLTIPVLWRAGLPLLPAVVLPLLAMVNAPHGASEPFAYDHMIAKVIYPFRALRDAWMLWDVVSIGLVSLAIYWFARGGRFAHDRGLVGFAVVLLAIYLVMPNTIQESQYADMRLVPLLFMLPLIAARPLEANGRAFAAGLAVVGLLFTGARWAGNGIAMAQRATEFAKALSVLDALPVGTNLVTFYPLRCEPRVTWNFDRRDHISGYALSRRIVFDSRQWQMSAGQLLRVHNSAAVPYDYERQIAVFDVPCGDKPGIHQAFAQLGPGIDRVWVIGVWSGLSFPGWQPYVTAGDSVLFRRSPAEGRATAR